MTSMIVRRIGISILVLLTISTLSFLMLKASGDLSVSMAGEGGGADYAAFLRKTYGWDRPLMVQYFDWLWRLLRGDLGTSFYYGSDVSTLVLSGLAITLKLGAAAIALALAVAIPVGALAGRYPDGLFDRFFLFVATIGQATPIFWLGFLLILLFGLKLALLPISGSDSAANYVMPAMALAFYAFPALLRIVRAGMMEAFASDYVRTARAKGLRWPTVVIRHALRNALVPVVAIASVQFGFLLSGSVVVESIFGMHGVGYLTWEAIDQNDYPVVQAAVLAISVLYVLLTLLTDVLNMLIDPRIRFD